MSHDGTDAENDTDDQEFSFENLPDGSGCTEIWEYLSERRQAKANGE